MAELILTMAQGYAIGSAALVSLALFGAYVTRAEITTKDSSILAPEVRFASLVDRFTCELARGVARSDNA
jgi:Na+/H+-translocating membrane pyrophosphatase